MNYYIDWANTKKLAVLNATQESPKLLTFNAFLESLNKKDEVYLETGCPWSKIRKIKERGSQVYMVSGNLLALLREGQKTDENDALSLREMILNKKVEPKPVSDKYLKYHRLKPLQTMYELYTRTNSRAMNIRSSFEREHAGDSKVEAQIAILSTHVDAIEKMKEKLAKEMKKEFAPCVKKLSIKGVAHCLLGQILSIAPPPLFKNRGAYLRYCGLKQLDHERYNRIIKSLYFLCTDSIVKQKNSPYRDIYEEFKHQRGMIQKEIEGKLEWVENCETKEYKEFLVKYESKKVEHLNSKSTKQFVTFKSYVEKIVRNRIATFIAKKVYDTFKDEI